MAKIESVIKKLEKLHAKRAALYKQIADTETMLIKEAKGTAKCPTPPAKKAEAKKPGRKPDVKKPKK